MRNSQNLDLVRHAAVALGSLCEDVVFLGGATVGLLLSDPAAPEVRPTTDVDVILEVASIIEYHHFQDQLRERGFSEDTSAGAPICRWIHEGVTLDVMPTDESILGWGNPWYESAIRTRQHLDIGAGHAVWVIDPPHLIATKLAAYRGRGHGDLISSHDIEDVITLIDGRAEIESELEGAPAELRQWVSKELQRLIDEEGLVELLPGMLPPDAGSQARSVDLKNRLRTIIAKG